jgi:hypothetical protein
MRTFAIFALACLALPSPVFAKNICLRNSEILNTYSDDGKTLIFKMRDGRVLVNHLHGSCPGLKYDGLEWTLRGIEEVCENHQTLRVLRSGQICVLGKFDVPIEKQTSR